MLAATTTPNLNNKAQNCLFLLVSLSRVGQRWGSLLLHNLLGLSHLSGSFESARQGEREMEELCAACLWTGSAGGEWHAYIHCIDHISYIPAIHQERMRIIFLTHAQKKKENCFVNN